jgi:small subunit ribosomal protein S3
VFRPWEANWFANPKDYTKMLHEDLEMRRVILARLRNAGIAKIETERSSNAQLTVTIHTAKPGIVIGKGGSSVDQLREDLEKRFGNRVRISIQEIKQPELDAQLVAENIASQIERRISYKRAMKQAILRTMRSGAKGVRIYCGGRLRGAEMARREWDREGRVRRDRRQVLDLQGRGRTPAQAAGRDGRRGAHRGNRTAARSGRGPGRAAAGRGPGRHP